MHSLCQGPLEIIELFSWISINLIFVCDIPICVMIVLSIEMQSENDIESIVT